MTASTPPAWPTKQPQNIQENTPIMRPAAEVRSIGFDETSATDAEVQPTAIDSETQLPTPSSKAAESPVTVAPRPRGAPLAKRPKGRLFVGSVLLGSILLLAGQIWTTWFQTEFYGEVTGRVVQVATPWDGNVQSWCVAEGQQVQQGELLAVMRSPRLEEQLATANDELRIAESMLSAELSKIQTAAQFRKGENRKSVSEYYEVTGEYLREQARHQQLEARLKRIRRLAGSGAVSDEAVEDLRWQTQGQQQRMESLASAVEQLRQRALEEDPDEESAAAQMRPFWLRVETLTARIQRLRETLSSGHLVAPVDGVVTQRVVASTEYAHSLAPVVDVLESGSLEVVLYVTESEIDRFPLEKEVPLRFAAQRTLVPCRVTRVEPILRDVSRSLSRYYNRGQKLAAVHLQPTDPGGGFQLRLGMLVKAPRWPALAIWRQERLP